jgi:alpha-ketoglutarate-dependent taurine dioxygenase
MGFEAIDLSETIGTEIRTADPAALLNRETAGDLRRLLIERGVLVFKRLDLSDEQQVTLAGLMGTLRNEGVNHIFKVTIDPKVNKAGEYLKGSFLWHMDGTHDDVPLFASLLSGRTLSDVGGETEFANSYAAYEHLPEDMKRRIEGLKVVHSVGYSMSQAGVRTPPGYRPDEFNEADKVHNLVWTHEGGRKSLVIGCHASHVVGMDIAAGRALIEELIEWTTQPRFVYRHHWDVGDLLIWDNTGVLHRAEPYPLESGRVMHRTTLVGEEAFA